MKRAHKNILGLSGLGLVAAVTTFAATLPAPMAGAVSTVTDVIQVTVVPDHPSVTLTTGSGGEITSPEYNFSLSYADLSHIKVTLVNYDSEGSIIYSETLLDEDLDWQPGTQNFNLNLDNYGGKGNFVITATGTGYGSVNVEDILSVIYKTEGGSDDGGDVNPGDDGDVDVGTEIPIAEVKSVKATLYSSAGLEVWSDTLNDPAESETLDFSGLPNGIYTLVTISRDADGNVLQRLTRTIVIDDGSGTGGFDDPVDPTDETVKVVVTVTNEAGEVVYTTTLDNPSAGDTVHIDTDGLEPGVYMITKNYYNANDEIVKTETEQFTKSETNGRTEIPIEQNIDVVTMLQTDIYNDATGEIVRVVKADRATGTAYIYDAKGNLLFTIPNGYRENMKKGDLIVPMEGLDAGDYTAILMYKAADGRIVGNTKTFRIHWDGEKSIIVPDTGGFFQGLNISREDYLITGAVVFAVIGVVAFGVVARNRNNKKVSRRSRR